jgi:hypothetical protein
MEIAHSSEQFDNVPLVYVWLRGDDNRRTQYKAQRTIDLVQQIAFDQGREQTGVLRWCTKTLQPIDPLPAEAHLVMYDQRGMQMLQGIRVCSRRGFWRVYEAEANNWLQAYRLLIGDDRSWLYRNGLPWDGVTIRLGDLFWVEGELVESPNDVMTLLPEASLVWWKQDSLIAEQVPVIRAQADLKQLRAAYRRGEVEIRRDGMLWQDERVIPNSRWEISTNEEFDPARLEAEGKLLPLPPPVLGIRYFIWKFAPRAVPINKDPLRWLKLSADDWQVSGDQSVPKGMGGYGSDDEDDGDSWESQPRFPDQPSRGPRDLWDKAKVWVTQIVAREHPDWSNQRLVQNTVALVKQRGWEWLGGFYLEHVPGEVEKRLAEGIPMSPNGRTVRDHLMGMRTDMSVNEW